MYTFKQEKLNEIKGKYKLGSVAKECGLSTCYLSQVLHNKLKCKKSVAFIIVKTLGEEYKIEDYFIAD